MSGGEERALQKGSIFCRGLSQRGREEQSWGLSYRTNAPVQPAATLGANSSTLRQHSNLLSLSTLFPLGSLSHVVPDELLEHLQPLCSHVTGGLFLSRLPPYRGLAMNTAGKVSSPPSIWIHRIRRIVTQRMKGKDTSFLS